MFYTEKNSYKKTSLSDLQGAWENFRELLLGMHPFEDSNRVLFHVNEAMSWEIVRDLNEMKNIHLLVKNILKKTGHYESLSVEMDDIALCLEEAILEYGN